MIGAGGCGLDDAGGAEVEMILQQLHNASSNIGHNLHGLLCHFFLATFSAFFRSPLLLRPPLFR
jgi:hypothetical protein